MNTFFRICLFLCIGLVVFTLSINFVNTLGVFPTTIEEGVASADTSSDGWFGAFSGSSTGAVWTLAIAGGVGAGIVLSVLTRSIIPVGISVYSSIFWASYHNAITILDMGGYIDPNLLIIFTVAIAFIFVGSIVGMLTGSG